MGRMYAYSRITPGDCEEEIRSVMKEMQVADEDIYADHVTKKHRTCSTSAAFPPWGTVTQK